MRSPLDRAVRRAPRVRRHLAARLHAVPPRRVADGVWVVRGGLPVRIMNVYLLEEEGGGVCLFDAGSADMASSLAVAGRSLGGITRIVLGHAHPDHRGAAPALDASVRCHLAEVANAEGDGGMAGFDFTELAFPFNHTLRVLLERWDGGPVPVAGTVQEGEEIAAGFKVVHLPGHAPGLIGLFRERDGVALTSDCFYTFDVRTSRKGPPRVPHAAFTLDDGSARASIRKLAGLRPSAAWPGHADPVTDDVAEQLERAAAARG